MWKLTRAFILRTDNFIWIGIALDTGYPRNFKFMCLSSNGLLFFSKNVSFWIYLHSGHKMENKHTKNRTRPSDGREKPFSVMKINGVCNLILPPIASEQLKGSDRSWIQFAKIMKNIKVFTLCCEIESGFGLKRDQSTIHTLLHAMN